MPRAVFVSAHFEDAAAACGGIADALAHAGWTTTFLTVLARDERWETRREEDLAAAEILGAHDLVWYDEAERFGDRLGRELATYDLAFVTQALEGDAARCAVRAAVLASAAAGKVAWYRDARAIARDPSATSGVPAIERMRATCVPLSFARLARKLDACAAYASLVDARYGSVAAMRELLATVATDEGARCGIDASVECVVAGGPAAASLDAVLR